MLGLLTYYMPGIIYKFFFGGPDGHAAPDYQGLAWIYPRCIRHPWEKYPRLVHPLPSVSRAPVVTLPNVACLSHSEYRELSYSQRNVY